MFMHCSHVKFIGAYQVFDKVLKWHFCVAWDSIKYQILGITMIIHVYHVLHLTHARYLLLTCLAFITWFCGFDYVLFRTLCLLLWTNLNLIKFVFLFCVFALVSLLCVWFCKCIIVPLVVKNLWLTLCHHLFQKGPDIRLKSLTARDSRLP